MQEQIQDLLNNSSPIDIRAALFKQGDFDFIVKGKNEDGEIVTHEKQKQALQILTSNKYDEFLFGGAAGGSKTWTGCSWLLFMCICYPGTKYFVAREELKDLIESVKVTFDKVAKAYGFDDYKFNAVKNFIQFGNDSHINFIDLKLKPSDPNYEDVGSTEYTCGWIEEASQINEKGATVISSRVGRHFNAKYGIKGIVFYTTNPKRNWLKRDFYDKWKNGTLEKEKFYLPCYIYDNPFLEKDYVRKMQLLVKKDKASYERLYKGNWDYEDNPYMLCEQEMIEAIFGNNHVPYGKRCITADVARFGSDKAVIGYWSGWQLMDVITLDISKTTDIELAIKTLRFKYKVSRNRVVVDADGVGGGVVDGTGARSFRNNAKPIRTGKDMPNYKNLQVQCLYELAKKVNEGEIWIKADLTNDEKEQIKEELTQIQSKGDQDPERKLDCKSKAEIKQDIGRSPDWRDMLFMRVYFDLKKNLDLSTNWE